MAWTVAALELAAVARVREEAAMVEEAMAAAARVREAAAMAAAARVREAAATVATAAVEERVDGVERVELKVGGECLLLR